MSHFELYNAPQSTCSQRVRFVLNEKNLEFIEHKLDLFSGEQLQPDYLKLNPNGVVPTLIHDDKIVTDSAVIMQYLDELFSKPRRLVPQDPLKRAHMRSLVAYIDEIPTPAIRFPSYNLAFLPHFRSMSEEEFIALAESKPLRKEFLLTMGRKGFSESEMNAAMDRLKRAVVRMHDTMSASGGPWLMGEQFTLADIAVMPVIVRLEDINLTSFWDDKPTVAHWLEQLKAQDAFELTYYHGSLLTEKYPHLQTELN
ncbi:MAG: glutathione S-transferase family protein [Methyloligellaceae bacterium]